MVRERIDGGYVVKDANGQALAYVYARETRADAAIANVLTMDEARRIAIGLLRVRSAAESEHPSLFQNPLLSSEGLGLKARELGGLRVGAPFIGSLTLKSRAARSGREGSVKK